MEKPYALFLRADGLIEMVDVRTMEMIKVFKMKGYGHFVIKATFGGKNEEFVASGSEGMFWFFWGGEMVGVVLTLIDGDIYVWNTGTGELLLKKRAHTPPASCNSVAWNPKRFHMIASAGDDHTVRM